MLNLCFSGKGLISYSGIQFFVSCDKYLYYSVHLCIIFLLLDSSQWARAFLLFIEASRSRLDRPHLTPLVEWSARHTDLFLKTHYKRDGHSCPRGNLNPQSQRTNSSADPRLKPCGHWEPLIIAQRTKIFRISKSAKTYEYFHCVHVHDARLHCLKIHAATELRTYKSSSECFRRSL